MRCWRRPLRLRWGRVVAGGVLHLGFVGDFFGRPVLLGYINGVAVMVIAGQIEKLLGLDVAAFEFLPTVRDSRPKSDPPTAPPWC